MLALGAFAACARLPAPGGAPGSDTRLRESLPVAAAALSSGQLDFAGRLYSSLAEHFDDAPEPFLGLGYVAFQRGDFAGAEKSFLKASKRASGAPAVRAEALLGAGRAALVRNRVWTARRHFRKGQEPARDTPSAAWIANGLAVARGLGSDFEAAEAHYSDALQLSSGHPRITANYVRMLVAAGRIDDAARAYAKHPPAWWATGDGPALSRLIEEAQRERRLEALARPAAVADTAPDSPPARTAAHDAQRAPDGSPGSAAPEGVDPAPPPYPFDRRLALRLYVPGPPPGHPSEDTMLPEGFAPSESSSLTLRLARWTSPWVPVPDTNDAAPSSSAPAAVATGIVAPSPVPEPLAARPERPARDTPSAAAIRVHPLPESETPAVAALDPSAAGVLHLPLGQSRRLHLERDATSVLVASPEIADVQLLAPNVLYVIGKGVGRTSVAVLDDRESVEERVISVALDLEPVHRVLAGEPDLSAVRARRLSRGMALTGEVASAAAADRALRLATVALPEGVPIENGMRVAGPQQVNLEVQIAEVHRSVTEELGVNWEAIGTEGAERFGFRIGTPPPTVAEMGSGAFSSTPFLGGPASSVFFGSQGPWRGQFRAMIDALATAGLANVLARPNVTAVSGESAAFFSGGERPIPTGFDRDSNTVIFEYKKVGILLDFVPTVVETGRIVLTVRPEVSEPDFSEPVQIGPVTLPVINVRRAETTVEVGDGESIVIAGLFRNRSVTEESGVPILKDVPLLGLLFSRTATESDELELIVVVTARLVQPNAAPDEPSTPPPATLRANGYHY